MRRLLSLSVASAIALGTTGCLLVDASCGGGGGASIHISPTVVFVSVGQSTTPKASWCRNGRYDNMNPQWSLGSSADANVISLDPVTGRITGKRAGTATVIATYQGVEGSRVTVTVQ
jgi:uncharacterized protein YjdB